MLRARAGFFLSLALWTVACGARTGLFLESEQTQATAGAGNVSAAGNASAAGNVSAAGAAGAPSVPPPPVSTNCQLTGNDPRVAGIKPDEVASLDGADFVTGDVQSYHWTLQMEDCDAVVSDAQFTLQGVDSRVVKFQPSRPAFYHFTLEVTGKAGDRAACKLEVPVQGIGMRVELCWDTSTTTDLDLYLHTPYDREPWFARDSTKVDNGLDNTTCNTSNGTALLRDQPRVNWGYADSALSACNTPSFDAFLGVGRCPNPRAADDNNQSIAIGTTERMQLDNPRDGQSFRVMVQNYDHGPAHPHVFVYCAGQRVGAFDAPAMPANFVVDNPGGFGLMWRAADISTNRDAAGEMFCNALPVLEHALTVDDPTF